MKRFRRYGKNEWKLILQNLLVWIIILCLAVGATGAGYVFLLPKYRNYRMNKLINEEEQQKQLAQMEEDSSLKDTDAQENSNVETTVNKDEQEVINHPEPAPVEENYTAEESSTPVPQPTVATVLPVGPAVYMGQKVKVIAANASSVISQEGVNNEPMLLFDGRDETSWQEGVDGYGAGESVAFSFDGTYAVTHLRFKLGNWKSDEYYYGNARPKTMTVILGDFTQEIIFSGERRPEWVELSNPVIADSMRIILGDVYEGTTWEDTAIAEIEIYGE